MSVPHTTPNPDVAPPLPRGESRRGLVIVPTYNEIDNISRLLPEILDVDPGLDVLVVDDGSPDGTAQAVRTTTQFASRVFLLERGRKMGLGSAYIAGFQWALRAGYPLVFEMDADFSHNPQSLHEFLRASAEADLVLGSRYLNGITVVNWPLRRLILSVGANMYARFVTGVPVKDCTGGFKCFRREVLEALPLERIRSDGYSFQIEVNWYCWQLGFRLHEIPILFVDRHIGMSKMNRRIIWEAVWLVWKLRFTKARGR
ncbi:MAG TPA: polyprenol monophosphomannose synthase [Candidatus Krumholzibacteria bacterium]|nr:polyprenol monophosphomannose synthase [Candidatus Krumholzibacteria bacterium]